MLSESTKKAMAKRTKKLHPDEKTKDEIRGSQLVNMLAEYGKTGKYNGFDIDPNRIAAAKAVLPFLRPTFSSIEQTIVNHDDAQSEADILVELQALVDAHPDLIRSLLNKEVVAPAPAPDPAPTPAPTPGMLQ